jgi:hypothetical protein
LLAISYIFNGVGVAVLTTVGGLLMAGDALKAESDIRGSVVEVPKVIDFITDVPDPKSYNRLNIIDILCFLIKYVATKIIDLL